MAKVIGKKRRISWKLERVQLKRVLLERVLTERRRAYLL